MPGNGPMKPTPVSVSCDAKDEVLGQLTEMLPSHFLSGVLHDVEGFLNPVACAPEGHDKLERLDEFGVEGVFLVSLSDYHLAHQLQLRYIVLGHRIPEQTAL
jgi:hypothetical protein